MSVGLEDQAAGLRRLFRQAPPVVVAAYATGHRAHASIEVLARRLGRGGQQVLVLDESPASPGAPGLDLLHALDGRVGLAEVCQRQGGALTRVRVGLAAATFALLDDPRRESFLGLLEALHRRAAFVLVQGGMADRPSPLAWAAPRRLLVAEASGRGATEACALVREMAHAGVGSLYVAVSQARSREDAARYFAELEALVRRRLGVPLAWLGEVERDDLGASLSLPVSPSSPRESERAFMRRLRAWGQASRTGTQAE